MPEPRHQSEAAGHRPARHLSAPRLAAPARSFRAFALGLLVLFALLGLLYQFHTQLDTLEARLLSQPAGGERLQAMGRQMGVLRERLHGLMADSVEMRLKSLERSLSSGRINAEDLALFQTLQQDLKALESYSEAYGPAGLDDAGREHPRYQAAGAVAAVVSQSELLREISRLRLLLYLCLTGLVAGGGFLAARSWLAHRATPALKNPARPRTALLPRNRRTG